MGRRRDTNEGASAAAFVAAVIVGFAAGSWAAGVGAFVGLCVVLHVLRIIR